MEPSLIFAITFFLSAFVLTKLGKTEAGERLVIKAFK